MTTRATGKLHDFRAVAQLPQHPSAAASQLPAAATEPVFARRQHAPLRLLWLLDSLPMRAIRRLIAKFLGQILHLAAYGSIALAVGLASAWYMVEAGSRLTLDRDGPWKRWTQAGAPSADPYTRAHFARAGWLPLSGDAAAYLTTSRDSAGEPLYSDCVYTVSGSKPAARRWTLSAFDLNGALLDSGPGQSVASSDTALPGPGGTLAITISQSPSPGNWLNVTGSTRMQLLLTLYGIRQNTAVKSSTAKAAEPLRIDKESCR